MEIQINGYPVNFELENEKTVLDVVNSISEWVKQRNLIFTDVYIDGVKYFLEDVPEMNIDEIKLLNSVVQSKSDIVISTIDEGINYCDIVFNFIKSRFDNDEMNEEDAEHIASGIEWLIEVLVKVLSLTELKTDEVKFKDKFLEFFINEMKGLKNRIIEISDKDMQLDSLKESVDLFQHFKEIFTMLVLSDEMKNLIMNSVESPDTLIVSLKKITEEMPQQIKNVENIAVAFQTGNDLEGSEKMNLFADFIYQYIRTCYQISPVFDLDLSEVVIDGVSILDKNSEIKNHLNDISEVMENNDIISLADILEYEMMPALESISEYLNVLVEKIAFVK